MLSQQNLSKFYLPKQIIEMGFTRDQVVPALRRHRRVEDAIQHLLNGGSNDTPASSSEDQYQDDLMRAIQMSMQTQQEDQNEDGGMCELKHKNKNMDFS